MKKRFLFILVTAITTLNLLTIYLPAFGQKAEERWQIVLSKSQMQDEAIKVALDDLKETGKKFGLTFNVLNKINKSNRQVIVVGDGDRNNVTANLIKKGNIILKGFNDPEGYEIITKIIDGRKTIIVAGGSIIGDVYGLYWIWDRMRIFKEIPDINVKRMPELKIRFVGGGGSSKEAMKNALRNSANWVSGENLLNLVPWEAEPERTENQENRKKTKELIKYAHSLHIKYFTYADEFTYHPSLLKEFDAALSPSDNAFWDALQAKYRRLLQVMPELDGVKIRTGELTNIFGNYNAFDVMHDGEECNWSLEKRYRTFVKKIYDVVVGEFDKIYCHRTWGTNLYEQHSQPDVFRNTFTEDISVRNLIISIKLTRGDCWYYQPYNPTFGITAHKTMVEFQSFQEYHSSSGNFPDFPGQYYQAGIQTILESGKKNLKAASFGSSSGWRTLSGYAAYRLSWNPYEDMRKIAKEFASIYFGKAAADKMADIYLLSSKAYKYGLYIEPIAYSAFNSLPQLRHNVFPTGGYPSIDKGKEHIHWLYSIYLRCKPWIPETLDYLDHGLQISNRMSQIFQQVKPLIDDRKLARDVENSLKLTRFLIQTNNLYVKACFAYFEYRDAPTVENRSRLSKLTSELKDAKESFIKIHGCRYHFFGIDQLSTNIEEALKDLKKAEEILAKAPDLIEIEKILSNQQEIYTKVLGEHSKNAIKFLHWEGRVDGRDILKIKGKNLEVEHLRWNRIKVMKYNFLQPLPDQLLTVIPVDIESRPMHPFILEHPCRENNYTVKVYLNDLPGGGDWFKFDLYYIPKSPKELGLEIPWGK